MARYKALFLEIQLTGNKLKDMAYLYPGFIIPEILKEMPKIILITS